MNNLVCIMSSPVLVGEDGSYSKQTVQLGQLPPLKGCPHYVGHPDTKALLESHFRATHKAGKFSGLKVGESFLAVPLQNLNREAGWTFDQAVAGLDELQFVVITRLA